MFYLFLLIVAAIAAGLYLVFIFNTVPEVRDQRLGVLEPLPDDLGKWKTDSESPAGRAAERQGLVCEVRHINYEGEGFFGAGKLVKQVRYKNRASGVIERVDPEQVIKRRRVKKG